MILESLKSVYNFTFHFYVMKEIVIFVFRARKQYFHAIAYLRSMTSNMFILSFSFNAVQGVYLNLTATKISLKN